MALVFTVEDGSVVAGANAYATLQFVRQYLEDGGKLEDWDGDDLTATIITGADIGDDTVEIADHPFITGDGPVRAVGADLPSGLVADTDYWIVVEDEDNVSLAESYADAVADPPVIVDLIDAGSGSRTLTHPDFDAQRTAIINATRYIDTRWGDRFKGHPVEAGQPLEWPKYGVYDRHGNVIGYDDDESEYTIPVQLQQATAEYALRALSGELVTDPGTTADVVSQTKTVGPLSKSTQWSKGTSVIREYPAADMLVRPLLRPASVGRA